jgi:hypothetical protein
MSQDIGDTCLRSSATTALGRMLGHAATHVEGPPGHHRPVRRPPEPGRGRRRLRRAPRLGVQAQSPLRGRRRGSTETAIAAPQTSPNALSAGVVALIVRIGTGLAEAGLDAGPETIAWHLHHHHGHQVSRSTISRHLTAAGLVTPEPKKRPKSSYIRFQASMPNQTWQSDFTHYRLVVIETGIRYPPDRAWGQGPLLDHASTQVSSMRPELSSAWAAVRASSRVMALPSWYSRSQVSAGSVALTSAKALATCAS